MSDLLILDTPAPEAVTPAEAQSKPRDGRALSAHRHGMTGKLVLLTQEEQLAYAEHCNGLFEDLQPGNYVQRQLVRLIAADRWLAERGTELESALEALEIEPDAQTIGDPEIDRALIRARAWIARGKDVALLSLYASRIQRRIDKNMAELRKLQAESRARKAEEDAKLQRALEDARVLVQLAVRDKEPLEPVLEHVFANFDFSLEQAAGLVSHYSHLWDAHDEYGDPKNLLKRAA